MHTYKNERSGRKLLLHSPHLLPSFYPDYKFLEYYLPDIAGLRLAVNNRNNSSENPAGKLRDAILSLEDALREAENVPGADSELLKGKAFRQLLAAWRKEVSSESASGSQARNFELRRRLLLVDTMRLLAAARPEQGNPEKKSESRLLDRTCRSLMNWDQFFADPFYPRWLEENFGELASGPRRKQSIQASLRSLVMFVLDSLPVVFAEDRLLYTVRLFNICLQENDAAEVERTFLADVLEERMAAEHHALLSVPGGASLSEWFYFAAVTLDLRKSVENEPDMLKKIVKNFPAYEKSIGDERLANAAALIRKKLRSDSGEAQYPGDDFAEKVAASLDNLRKALAAGRDELEEALLEDEGSEVPALLRAFQARTEVDICFFQAGVLFPEANFQGTCLYALKLYFSFVRRCAQYLFDRYEKCADTAGTFGESRAKLLAGLFQSLESRTYPLRRDGVFPDYREDQRRINVLAGRKFPAGEAQHG